jgi:uncharacterized protein (TIGR02246 family)
MTSVNEADEQAIRALIDLQVTGWDAADPDTYASVFTPDADYVTFLGSRHEGREAIASSYALLFNKLHGTRLRIQIIKLRYLAPDVALIQARAAVVRQQDSRWNRRGERVNTSIAVRTDDGWRLAASQNTPHRRFAEKFLGVVVSRRSHSRTRQDGRNA